MSGQVQEHVVAILDAVGVGMGLVTTTCKTCVTFTRYFKILRQTFKAIESLAKYIV